MEDEDGEHGFAEAEVFRSGRFRKRTDLEVDLLHIVVVDLLKVFQNFRVVGEVFELLDGVKTKLPTHLIVARDATLAVAENVYGSHVEETESRHRKVLQCLRVVIENQLPRVLSSERMEHVGQSVFVHHVRRFLLTNLVESQVVFFLLADSAHFEGVGQHGVEDSVVGNELFGEPGRHAVLFNLVSNQSTDSLVGHVEPGNRFAILFPADRLGGFTVPVGQHPGVEFGVRKNIGSPFHSVDLSHQGRVDQAGFVKQLIVVPVRVRLLQHIRNGVVLLHEHGMHGGKTQSPVAAKAGLLDAVLAYRKLTLLVEAHLAALACSELFGLLVGRAVNLRAVPPVSDLVEVSLRSVGFGRFAGGVVGGLGDQHVSHVERLTLGVVFGQGNFH